LTLTQDQTAVGQPVSALDVPLAIREAERMVQTSRLSWWAGFAILAMILTIPVGFHNFLGSLVAWLIVAAIFYRAYDKGIVLRIRDRKYQACAARLVERLESLRIGVTHHLNWVQPLPSALGISNGAIAIAGPNTGFEPRIVEARHLIEAKVERTQQHFITTKHEGRVTVGGGGRGVFTGYTFGGRSHSTTRTIEDISLEITYDEGQGLASSIAVPFGDDRISADRWCATLNSMIAAARR